MALELFYTSAPRGLKPQTSGFCTVGMTRGFPAPFISRLEALSGYRPPREDATIADSPLAWSHWVIDAAGVERHVLSVVGAAPPDHTLRNNKFAHHLLLREDELSEAGPAWVLAQPGTMMNTWIGEPRLIERERTLASPARSADARCATWESVCGDAGWAGVIANVVMIDPSKSCSIVYPAGAPVLKLVDEALSLLPSHWRWRVTFTTYFMQPMAGARCAWKFCLDGTEAAAAARASTGTLVDLCARHPCTQTGTFIDRARRGDSPQSSADGSAESGHSDSLRTGSASRHHASRGKTGSKGKSEADGQLRAQAPSARTREEPQVQFGIEYVEDRQARVRTVVWSVAVAAGIALVLIVGASMYWRSMQSNPAVPTMPLAPSAPASPVSVTPGAIEVTPPILQAASARVIVSEPTAPSQPALDPPRSPSDSSSTGSAAGSVADTATVVAEAAALSVVAVNAGASASEMPSRASEWTVLDLPSPNKQNDESWIGKGALRIDTGSSDVTIASIAWKATPDKLVDGFEFPDRSSFARRDQGGVLRTIATISTEGSQPEFRWCADGELVRTHPKLLAESTAALAQVPIVATLSDGAVRWCSWDKLATKIVGPHAIDTLLAVSTAPWQVAVDGGAWSTWGDAANARHSIAVTVATQRGVVEVGTLSLQRKGSKCSAFFELNAAHTPELLRSAVERARADQRQAQIAYANADADTSERRAERVVEATTAALNAKSQLASAIAAFESARQAIDTAGAWETLCGTEQGVPIRLVIRPTRFAELEGLTR